ncbi:MAG: hypothetical protein CM15mP74_23210 [Halieaceae bacterium]|nr:MAG: hypothetical protein CM15mP74_23210 [Halieaceae bacterium]
MMAELGEEGELSAFLDQVRNDESSVTTTPRLEVGVSRRGTYSIDRMAERLPDYFGLLPQSDLIVKRVEAYRSSLRVKRSIRAPRPMVLVRAFTTPTSTT